MYRQAAGGLRWKAQTALDASPIYELRALHIEQTADGLVISGRVSCFYHKQLAQETVRQVSQSVVVTNSITVE